jgi:hypothetical protein
MYALTYTFRLRNDGCYVEDDTGVALTDNASAYQYARTVARADAQPRSTNAVLAA